jgi:hypothetical protein
MEIEYVTFTSWRWSSIEVDGPVEAHSFYVDAKVLTIRRHWFLKKSVMFELRGPRVGICQFIEKKLEDGSCRSARMGKPLQRRISQVTPSARS